MNDHEGNESVRHTFNFTLNKPEDVLWRKAINLQMRLTPGFDDKVFYPTLNNGQMCREYQGDQKTFATGANNIPWLQNRYLKKRPDTTLVAYQSKVRPEKDAEADVKQHHKTKQLHQ